MAKKGGLGLGRGLDALMGTSQAAEISQIEHAEPSPGTQPVTSAKLPEGIEVDADGGLWVDPAFLRPNPKQPRTEFDAQALDELADSIRENGVVQPIIIEPAGEKNFYIIAGERRTRAAKMAGLSKVPVQLRRYNDQKKLEIALIENIQRSDLNPIEEATAYYNLMQMGDLSQDEVAQRVGKKRSTVANAMRLLKLPEDMQKSLISGQLSAGHARALLSVVNPADQRVLFGRIIGGGLSVRQTEELAGSLNNGGRAGDSKKKQKKAVKKDPDILAIEQKFLEKLGTRCLLNGTLEKGSIEIDYFSRADLDRLYNLITGSD
ncbi:MAG TPA: chromosome partitioning protein ParB [Treponema sp.]|nr:chromosome partitioning protein ParB [Treponema sp.]